MRRRQWLFGILVAAAACGGSTGGGEDTVEPAPCPECSTGDKGSGEVDSTIIPEEKYEEIKKTFQRKTGTISRCYVEGFEAGEVEKSEKGHVTVGLTIQPDGSPSDVRVLETSFKSQKVGDCVVRMVSGWKFTTLPKSLDTSHTYVLDRL
ncbi:MAG TPA: AgmX/PglI C-terminal domain-containing protein [Kofleriaceae bacterium]|jgi:hypothetical protein